MVQLKTFIFNHWPWIFLIVALLISMFLIPPAKAEAATTLFQMSPTSTASFSDSNSGCIGWTFNPVVSGTINRMIADISVPGSAANTTAYVFSVSNTSNPLNYTLLATSSPVLVSNASRQSIEYVFPDLAIIKDPPNPFNAYEYAIGYDQPFVFYMSASAIIGTEAAGSSFSAGYPSDTNQSDCNINFWRGGLLGGGGIIILDNGATPPPVSEAIQITAFLSDTGTGAFWGVNFTAATSTTYQAYVSPFYQIDITAGNTSSTFESTLVGRQDLAQTTSGVATSTLIPALQSFIPGITYYSQAQLIYHAAWGDAGRLVATSSIFSFYVAATTTPGYFPIPTSTATSSEFVITCDPNSGFFSNSLCNLFQYLFVPSPAALSQFSNLKTLIQHKPPFGYFAAIQAALSGLSTSTPAVSLPDLAPLENNFLTPIRTGVGWLLWFLFAFWAFSKFRNFEL